MKKKKCLNQELEQQLKENAQKLGQFNEGNLAEVQFKGEEKVKEVKQSTLDKFIESLKNKDK